MAITNFSAKYRTLKIGFLVAQDHFEGVVEVAKINSLLWGGVHNPIIPVGSNIQDAVDLINHMQIDILHPVAHNENIDAVLAKFPFLKAPRHFTYEMFVEDWDTKKRSPVYLDSLNIIEKHYHKYFKGVPADKGSSNCVLPTWSEDDPLAKVFTLNFGTYRNNFNLKEDFENAFLKGLRAKKYDIEKNKNIDASIGGKIDPIYLTSIELKNYRRELLSHDGVYIGKADNFDDLVYFWNIRASGVWVQFLPIDGHERFKDFIQSHIGHLNSSTKKPDYRKSILFYFRNKEEKEVDPVFTIFQQSGISVHKSDITQFTLFEILQNLPSDILGWEFTNGYVDQAYGKYVVNVSLPEKKFLSSESDRDVSKQELAVSLDSFTDFGFSGYTLKLPYITELNEFYSREISYDPWKIRAEEESVGVIIDTDDKTETLYPIEHQVLINKVFDHAGITAEKSQAGLLTEEIIKSMRENESLEACRVFKITGVRKLLKQLQVGEGIKYSEALKIIGSNNFNKHKGLFIESRNERDLSVPNVFDYLIKKRILKPYLHFLYKITMRKKEFRCSKCGLKSNIRYKEFEGYWVCEYCEHKQYLPTFIPDEFKDRSCWKYIKRGLFAKENNQEGAIPVILALLVFKHVFSGDPFLYSTSLRCEGCDKKPEIDFAIFRYGHYRERIELAFGECKSDGGRITKDDIEKLKSVKEQFETKGIRCHFVFAKTADSFTKDELTLFKKLWNDNHSVILFANKELETNHHLYWDDDDYDKLPNKHALNFSELARNSHFRYLQDDGKNKLAKDSAQEAS